MCDQSDGRACKPPDDANGLSSPLSDPPEKIRPGALSSFENETSLHDTHTHIDTNTHTALDLSNDTPRKEGNSYIDNYIPLSPSSMKENEKKGGMNAQQIVENPNTTHYSLTVH